MKMAEIKSWGFTVDDIGLDGYSTEAHLNILIDFLEDHGVKATLFAVPRVDGKRLDQRHGYVSILRDAIRRGHEVAQHGLEHDRFEVGIPPDMVLNLPHEGPARKFLSENKDKLDAEHTIEKIQKKLHEGREIVENAIGMPVRGFRAPALQTCNNLFPALAAEKYLYDSSTCLQPAAWDILNNVPYTPRDITLDIFHRQQKPGLRELPLTAEYTWYLERNKFDETYGLAVHDLDACLQAGIPFVNICHVSPIQTGPDPELGFELYRKLFRHGQTRAGGHGFEIAFKTLAEIADSSPHANRKIN